VGSASASPENDGRTRAHTIHAARRPAVRLAAHASDSRLELLHEVERHRRQHHDSYDFHGPAPHFIDANDWRDAKNEGST
jgi:hypothetical protein